MYVADGQWSPTAINKSPGGMAILKRMIERRVVTMSGSPPPPASPSVSAVAPIETIKRIQEALGVVSDGDFGPRSRAALNVLLIAAGQATV
jgi:hypothetical protein